MAPKNIESLSCHHREKHRLVSRICIEGPQVLRSFIDQSLPGETRGSGVSAWPMGIYGSGSWGIYRRERPQPQPVISRAPRGEISPQ